MKYLSFGRTGLQVSQVALGTGNFGIGWGHGADQDTSKAMVASVEASLKRLRTDRIDL